MNGVVGEKDEIEARSVLVASVTLAIVIDTATDAGQA